MHVLTLPLFLSFIRLAVLCDVSFLSKCCTCDT